MFMAEVLSINADEKYIDEKGAFDITKCNLIALKKELEANQNKIPYDLAYLEGKQREDYLNDMKRGEQPFLQVYLLLIGIRLHIIYLNPS